MNARELNLLLFDSIPEIRKAYIEEISWQDGHDTGSHVIFGDVLCPYMEGRILQGDLQAVKRVIAFVEMVLAMDDSYCNNVIEVSFLETFFYRKEFVHFVEGELGPRARALWQRLADASWAPKQK